MNHISAIVSISEARDIDSVGRNAPFSNSDRRKMDDEVVGSLNDVPFESATPDKPQTRTYPLWIDSAYFEQVIPVFSIWLIILVIYPFFCYLFTDPKFFVARKEIPFRTTDPETTLNVDLSFNNLWRYKRFLNAHISFLRESLARDADFSFSIGYKLLRLDRLHLSGSSVGHFRSKVHFYRGEAESNTIPFLFIPINRSFNVIDVRAELKVSTPTTGIALEWAMANSRTYTCLSVGFASLFVFGFLIYQSYCLTFVWFLHPENLVSMLLFVTSLMSVNPLPYLFNIDIELIHVFFPLFLSAVKFHFIFGCNRLHCTTEERSTSIVFAVFLAVDTILNVFATISAEERAIEGGSIGSVEFARMVFHAAFAGIGIAYHRVCMNRDDGEHLLRGRTLLMMFAFVAVPEFIADAIFPIADAVQETIYGDVLKAVAAYGYLCAFSLFFKRKIGAIGINPESALFRIEDMAELPDQDTSLLGG
jgi:hypothetical protein